MSKLDKMIKELCPQGLEKVPLWEITAWDKRFNAVDKSMQKKIIKYNYFLAKELDDLVDNSGDIRILYTTEDIAYTTEEKADCKISEGEVVAIPWGGNPTVKYFNGRFVTGDNRIATSLDKSRLDNKYLYYWMLGQLDVISTFYRGAGIKHPSMFSVLTMEIPLPPLSIQQEIVSVLDSFTTLIDKMKQEVEKRKKQMEYYREKLLAFEDGECEWKLIGSFTKVFSASRVHKNEWKNSGVPFWRSSDVMSFHNGVENSRGKAYISHELYERLSAKSGKIHKGDLLVTGGGSIGMPYLVPDDTPLYVKDADLLCIVANNVVNNKFLYKYMMSNQFREYLKRITHDASIPHYTISQIKETPVPVISLSLQEEIVSTLDKFESYITKLEKMIVLRQKQYEYYREQLLTFRPIPSLQE